jgi:hypothetical protein
VKFSLNFSYKRINQSFMPIRLREKCREIAREASAGSDLARIKALLEQLEIPEECHLARLEAHELLVLVNQIDVLGDRPTGQTGGDWGANPDSLRLWLIYGLQSRLPAAFEEWHYREWVSKGMN